MFLANSTPPNKQSFKVKLIFKSPDHVSNSETIKKIYSIRRSISCFFFFFKQLPLNTKLKFEFACQLIDRIKLLSV